MLWHIMKREIYDHFTSLRFAFTIGLITLLMVLNALIFVGSDYEQRLSEYSQNQAWVADQVRASCEHLNELATRGPVGFYKRPSALAFCANDQEDELPMRIRAQGGRGTYSWGGKMSYLFKTLWTLNYVRYVYQRNSMIRTFTALDWSFIIGVVMSFVAILFTFDAISGERERGTLRLTLSNPVPRGALMLGKFLGSFITIAVPLVMGMLLNLLIVNVSGVVSLGSGEWARIGLMAAVSFIYVSLFIGLGLVVSGRMARSSTSLLVLLLIWVVLVVLVPNTLGSVVSTLRRVPSQREFEEQREAATREVHDSMKDRFKYGSPTQPDPDVKAIKLWADFVTKLFDTGSRLDDEHLDSQFAQVQLARRILRSASPTTIYNYTMESLADTGFERHRQFVKAARRHRERFIDFIKATDRSDSKSFHIYYLKEGLSDKPVSSDNVPRFAEATGVSAAIRNTFTHIGVLVVLSVLLLLISYVSFLRCDVR